MKNQSRYFMLVTNDLMVVLRIICSIFTLVSFPLFGQNYQDSIQDIVRTKLEKRHFLEEQLTTAKKQKNISLEMETLMKLVEFVSNDFGDLSSSYIYARELEKFMVLYPDSKIAKKSSSELYHNIGWYLLEQGKLENSIEYFNRSIEADTGRHLGQFYDNMYQLADAFDKMGDKAKKREVLVSLSEVLLNSPKYDPDAPFNRLRYYKVMRDINYNDGNYTEGLEYAKKSIDSIEGYAVTAFGYFRLAEFYIQLKHLDSAKIAGQKGLEIVDSQFFPLVQLDAHRLLYAIYEKENDFEQALYHLKRSTDIQNNIQSFDNALKIGTYDINSERNKAHAERVIATQKLSNQRLIIYIVTGFVILLLITLFYLFKSLKIIKEKNKIIAREKQVAEESERFKEQFLANMSHEIRTPMHAISAMLNALKRYQYSKEQANYLNAMRISMDNLLVILNDILDLSKIETGSLQLVSVPIDIRTCVSHVIDLFSSRAEEKGITLTLNVALDFPVKIFGDPVRLNQILVNLIGNAIKFTEQGSVEITLSRSTNLYSMEIKDTGIGIPSDSLQSVFEVFKQGEEGLNKGYSGTGLGLSITKQLIELQGGRIWAESKLGEGTTFFVDLPLVETHLTKPDVSTQEKEKEDKKEEQFLLDMCKSLTGLRILIADDNEFNSMVLEDDLKYYIPEVKLTVVENGQLAVEKYKDHVYDLILMDVQMPKMDGYEATRKIRDIEREKNVRRTAIIAMTAGINKNESELFLHAGMDAHILKPYGSKELFTSITKAMR